MFNRKGPSRLTQVAAAAAAALLGLSACSGAEGSSAEGTTTITVANAALEGTPHAVVYEAYLDLIEDRTDGRIEFDRTSFEALCGMAEVAQCVSDGRADFGVSVPDYTPNVFPTSTLAGVPFLSPDIQATSAALHEMHTTNDQAMAMMEKNNLHYAATWPVGTLFIGSKEPVENIDDLKGLSMRASGPATQAVLEDAGVNMNAITAGETYEGLQRGVIDSVASALDFATGYKINEQVGYWTDPGLGQYSTYAMWWNASTFDALPEDLQTVIDEASAEFNNGLLTETYNEAVADVCQGMMDATTVENFDRWDDAASEEWRASAGDLGKSVWLKQAADSGLEDPEGYLEAYQASYESHVSEDNPIDAAVTCVDQWQAQK
ncbi:MAG TPA: TRAP transporter substrate-binding protein DctP [Enteractinococcus sp.]